MAGDGEQQAMASERLAEIRAEFEWLLRQFDSGRREHAVCEMGMLLLAEVERQRAERTELVAVAVSAARLDDRDNIICECRLTMPVGHHDGCWLLTAQRIAHTLPSGEIE